MSARTVQLGIVIAVGKRGELYSLWHDDACIYQCSIIKGHHHHHNLNCSFDVQFILIVLYYYYYHRNRIAHARYLFSDSGLLDPFWDPWISWHFASSWPHQPTISSALRPFSDVLCVTQTTADDLVLGPYSRPSSYITASVWHHLRWASPIIMTCPCAVCYSRAEVSCIGEKRSSDASREVSADQNNKSNMCEFVTIIARVN